MFYFHVFYFKIQKNVVNQFSKNVPVIPKKGMSTNLSLVLEYFWQLRWC